MKKPEQLSLFSNQPSNESGRESHMLDRFEGALLGSAVGDALGWPIERLRSTKNPPFDLPVTDYVSWRKLVGGRFWGYYDDIDAGEYSDDTQLTLAVARSLNNSGRFDPTAFAYAELPLWLQYERGGGASLKTAARNLLRQNCSWSDNRYVTKRASYWETGANGAAMRVLPVALASIGNRNQGLHDAIFNSIITHGHPRAILGAVFFVLAVHFVLSNESPSQLSNLVDYVSSGFQETDRFIDAHESMVSWLSKHPNPHVYLELWRATQHEILSYLKAIPDFLERRIEDYYKLVGAYDKATRGSGTGTVAAAIYLFAKYQSEPLRALFAAANEVNTDTDTIAAFVGGLIGARYGTSAFPEHLLNRIQDRAYLRDVAQRLSVVLEQQKQEGMRRNEAGIDKRDILLRLLAWEIGLHEMFWDAISVGGLITHPTLGRGRIEDKKTRDFRRKGYIAKLIRVKFAFGQSCVFHSRIREEDGALSESLSEEVTRALESM